MHDVPCRNAIRSQYTSKMNNVVALKQCFVNYAERIATRVHW